MEILLFSHLAWSKYGCYEHKHSDSSGDFGVDSRSYGLFFPRP